MVIPCLSSSKKGPATTAPNMTRQQQNRLSLMTDELHAFDLTWRNYLPSVSSFCCFKGGAIRLDDDGDPLLVEPAYYNDHTLYRGEALQNYLDNSRDWEFESVLGQNDLPQFVTRNPFGTSSVKNSKKNKSSKKKKKHKRERPVIMETDMEEGGSSETVVGGYDIEDNHSAYYNDDAEFLGDDQIANLAYNRHSSQVTDQYGEELYYEHVQGPIVQEMQAPPPSQPREFYAARTMPTMHFNPEEEEENYGEYEERVVTVPGPSHITTKPQASIEAAQALLSERLDDLTEKLAFIKNNIIHIQPPSTKKEQTSDDECDRNTLHTIRRHNENEENTEEEVALAAEQNSTTSSDDIDSITSEALNVYENTTTAYENHHIQQQQQTSRRRYSSGDELHIPSLVDNTPFVSDQHPFTYFTDHTHDNSDNINDDDEEEETAQTSNNEGGIRNIVFDLGKKWFGV